MEIVVDVRAKYCPREYGGGLLQGQAAIEAAVRATRSEQEGCPLTENCVGPITLNVANRKTETMQRAAAQNPMVIKRVCSKCGVSLASNPYVLEILT